ncbi:hypothetical protein F4V43_18680 [Paenibacillus spiritus]|uniref:Uncharacterized protein n=1 Tax=Paenibacillus spiritus TaxID=2496557 RepID=A0A5J5FUC8_9BACL|nr:hypothetical protein [Paenibacillus spiritus]KAA8996337.1 hypothetical protein F4V43_18680 [Paenibacillus spiritus]
MQKKDYDLLIEEKRREVTEIKMAMEQSRLKFKKALSDFTEQWYRSYARKLIVNNPDTAGQLTDSELQELKNEVEKLAGSACEFVDLHFDKDNLWWHIKENTYGYSEYQDKRIPHILSEEATYLFGRLGLLFKNHNIIKIGVESGYRDESYKFDFVIDQSGKKNEIKLRHIGDFPVHLTGIIKEYGNLHEKAKSSGFQIERLLEEKRRNSIGDLWDSL